MTSQIKTILFIDKCVCVCVCVYMRACASVRVYVTRLYVPHIRYTRTQVHMLQYKQGHA